MRRKKKGFNQYVPENFDVDEFVLTHKDKVDFTLHRDEVIAVCSSINELQSYEFDYDYDGLVPLNATKMRQKGLRRFPLISDLLLKEKIIETDNQYFPGVKSRGFRFTSEYQTKVKILQIHKTTLVKKQKELIANARKRSLDESGYSYLEKWINPSLKIDEAAAKQYLEAEYQSDLNSSDSDVRKRALTRLNNGLIQVDRLVSGELRFSVDETAGRVHTNLTNIRSGLRQFITYDGQKLVSLDIKNSQPYHAIRIFAPGYWIREKNAQNLIFIKDKEKGRIIEGKGNSKYRSSIMLAKMGIVPDCDSFKRYEELVLSGEFYQFMKKELNLALEGIDDSNPEKPIIKEVVDRCNEDYGFLKKQVLKAFYSNNRYLIFPDAIVKRVFKEKFPAVYNLFAFIKTKNFTELPILLQKMECELVLKRIAGRVAREKPELPIFTIHDSIITTVGNQEYLKQVIEEEMVTSIGAKGILKLEYWKANEGKEKGGSEEMKVENFVNDNGVEITVVNDTILVQYQMSSEVPLERHFDNLTEALECFNVKSLDEITSEDLLLLEGM